MAAFSGLPRPLLEACARVVSRSHRRAGDVVVRQGEEGDQVFGVVRGQLKAVRITADGAEVILSIMGPGELFGEVAVLGGGQRSASVVSLTSSDLLAIPGEHFRSLLGCSPTLVQQATLLMAQRIARLTDKVEEGASLRLSGRLARELLRLGEPRAARRTVSSEVHIGQHRRTVSSEVHIGQQALGSMVGASRESVNRTLRAWHEQGLIEIGRGSITIRDVRSLQDLCEADAPMEGYVQEDGAA